MENWFASPVSEWFAPSDLHLEVQGKQKAAGSSAEIQALGHRKNRVQIGVPQTIDTVATWPLNERLVAEMAAAQDRYDFYCVRTACSFIPDRGCRFMHARLDITLSDAITSAVDGPITMDLFPREIRVKQTYSRSFGIKAGLKLAFIEMSSDSGRKDDVIRYDPSVGAGLLTGTPIWTFSANNSTALEGTTELFLLLKKIKGRVITAQFVMNAEVETLWGLFRYSKERLLETEYALSPVETKL